MNTDIDESIGNQKTMGGVIETDESSIGDNATIGRQGITLGHVDQYELVRELGGGGFGVVFLARDTVSGIEVAVKGLPPIVKNNEEELEQIRRNFALVSKLHHPNIAAALVLHRARDVHYELEQVRQSLRVVSGDTLMVMTYAPGVTLSKWRKQFPEGRVPVKQAIDVCQQIASAMDYAHGEKVVHRDIKPANVMIETRRRMSEAGKVSYEELQMRLAVKVLDFGLAAEIRSSMNRVSQATGDTSGTRPYMAPEQWAGKKQDGRTDQYALAVLFYELVSGEVPFAGAFETGDPVVMMAAVERNTPETLPMLSAAQNAALARALSKNPAQRYECCSAFAEALSGMQVSVEHSVNALGKNGAEIIKAVQTYNKTVSWVSRLPLLRYLQIGRELLVDLLAVIPPVSRFADRVLGMLVAPRDTWNWIRSEKKSAWEIYRGYALALVAISFLPSVFNAIHLSRYTSGYWTLGSRLSCVLLRYVLTLVGLFVVAKIIDGLAAKLDAQKKCAFKLVFFSLVPVFLAMSIVGFGGFAWLYWLAWVDALVLLYFGIRVLMECPKGKAYAYTAVTVALLVGLNSSVSHIVMRSEQGLLRGGFSSIWNTTKVRPTGGGEFTSTTPPSTPRDPDAPRTPQNPQWMFMPSRIYPGSAFPPMNLPKDVWLPPTAQCIFIQREFPSNSPTNTHAIFGLSSQSELSSFCEMMKTNGWRIIRMGSPNGQQYGRMGPPHFSASFAKPKRITTLMQKMDFSFELLVYGPEDDAGGLVKPADIALATVNGEPTKPFDPAADRIEKMDPERAEAIRLMKKKIKQQADEADQQLAAEALNKSKLEKEKELEAERLKTEEEARKMAAAAAEAEDLRLAEEERQKAEARRQAEAARATQLTNGLLLAKQMVDQEEWADLLVQANALLELDPQNATAKKYKGWAEDYLNMPILKLIAMVNGKEVNAQVKIDNEVRPSPVKLIMERTQYSVELSYEEGDKKYEAKEFLVMSPDWKGVRPKTITLREVKPVIAAIPETVSTPQTPERPAYLAEDKQGAPPSKSELPAQPVEGQEWVSPSTGMVFVWVKALKIWVGKYEVTNAEYRRKVPTHSSKNKTGSDNREYTLNGDRQPVVFIHFGEAVAYAEWLSQADAGKLQQFRYRLPTMTEFTDCMRCGVFLSTYPWGETWPPPVGQAGNYDDEKVIDSIFIENYRDGKVVTCGVEQSGKNAWGLFGVGGNVWECCSTDSSRSEFGGWRGGSWADASAGYMKCDFKSGAASMVRNEESGFRLVLSR